MRKLLLLATLATVSQFVTAEISEPICTWASLLVGIPGQDNSSAVITDGPDQIYWLCTNGSKTGDLEVYLGDYYLYSGAEYSGTSANKNLTLLKTDSTGDPVWVMHSNWGDFSNEGKLAVDPDGNIIFATTVRHTEGYLDKDIELETYNRGERNYQLFNWTTDRRSYRLIVASLTPDGKFNWGRTYEISTEPQPSATSSSLKDFTPQAISCKDIAVDNDGNIYVCGNFRAPMYLPCADGSEKILTPSNVAAWNGDSQKTAGDLYIIKLDRNGYYLNSLTQQSGEITAAMATNLTLHDGKLYFEGYLIGNGEEEATVDGHTFVPTSSYSPLIGCLDSELQSDWMACYPGGQVAGRNALQNTGITVANGNLWYVGQYNGRISSPADPELYVESTQGTMREGFLIKLNATDGTWLGATDSRTDFPENVLTGYLDVLVAPTQPDRVYVYGYGMNASVGVFLRGYSADDLTAIPFQTFTMVSDGGVPTACAVAYEPADRTIYLTARGNKAFSMLNWGQTPNPAGYTVVLARYTTPESMIASIDDAQFSGKKVSLIGAHGSATAVNGSEKAESISLFNLSGTAVWTGTVQPGASVVIPLRPGFYISSTREKIMVE